MNGSGGLRQRVQQAVGDTMGEKIVLQAYPIAGHAMKKPAESQLPAGAGSHSR